MTEASDSRFAHGPPNQYHGYIGQVSDSKVEGWVFRKDSDIPLAVALLVDDVIVARATADVMEDFLKETKQHRTGRCGFRFNLQELHVVLPQKCTVRVTVADGKYELWNSPWPYRVTEDGDTRAENSLEFDQFLFVHIPKCAGTSFGNMLLEQFPHGTVFLTDQDKMQMARAPSVNDYLNLSEERLAAVRLLMGHVPHALGRILPGKVHYLTILRHPVLRSMSHLLYAYRTSRTKATLEQFFQQIKITQLDNVATRFFSDTNPWNLEYMRYHKALDRASLEIAKENLRNCHFVGIAEHFTETVALADAKFGWKLGTPRHDNAKNAIQSPVIPRQIVDEIHDLTLYDMELYECGLEKFRSQVFDYVQIFGKLPQLGKDVLWSTRD